MVEPLKQKSPRLPGACFNHTVIQEKLNVHEAKAKNTATEYLQKLIRREKWKKRNVFLPWVESGETEETWKREKKGKMLIHLE